MEAQNKIKLPNLLVVDDDPGFRSLMSMAAKVRHIPITVLASLDALEELKRPGSFDVAIVDYFLDNLTGSTKGTEIYGITPSTPTILMSSSQDGIEDNYAWPTSIRKFINKKEGVNHILDSALTLYDNRFQSRETD